MYGSGLASGWYEQIGFVLRLKASLHRLISSRFFVSCLLLYVLNTLVFRGAWGGQFTFLRAHLNDFLLVPLAIPLLFEFFTLVKLRSIEGPPELSEFLPILIIWSLLFEVLGPTLLGLGYGDVLDVVSYFAGAAVSLLVWRREQS